MKFTIESSKLLQFIKAASKIVPQKNNSSIPILGNILFNIKGNVVHLTVSDSTLRLESDIELVNSSEDAEFTISEQILSQSLKDIPDQPISIEIDLISFDVVLTYSNGFYKFKGESSVAYPSAFNISSDIYSISIPTENLYRCIRSCKFATSIDEKRPIMTGVCLDFDKYIDGLVSVASDGRILVKYIDSTINKSNIEGKFCIPSATCNIITDYILSKEKGNVNLCIDENFLKIETANTTLFSRLLDGKYPNYNSVIPTQNPYEVLINKADFQGACRRVSVCSSVGNNLLVFHFKDNKVKITANNIEMSTSAEEIVTCAINDDTMDLKIGFDFNTLSKVLDNTHSSEIKFSLADQSRGGLIIPTEHPQGISSVLLIMPIRILSE